METNGTPIVTAIPSAPPAEPAAGQPPASQPDTAPKSGGKPRGINPQGILYKLAHGADAGQVKVLDLIFGTRKVGDEGTDQLVSILDTGSGKIDVYPVVSRFAPKPGHQIRCYVVLKTDKVAKKGRQVDRTLGFAIPINLREAARTGEWLDLRNNVLRVQFRAGKDGGFYGFGPNGKVVVVPEGAGFEPATDKETTVMVSETLKCYLAHCEVAEDMAKDTHQEAGLMLLAETVGAILEGVDTYGFKFGGQLFDACEILSVPTTASVKAINAVHRNLAKTEHPDKKTEAFRQISRMEPTPEDVQTFNHEWALIEEAKKVMLRQRLREESRQQYLKAGRETQKDLPTQISVGNLAKKLGKGTGVVQKALKAVGYDGTVGKTVVAQMIAWTAVGYIASGAIDDLSAPANGKAATTPTAPTPTAEAQPAVTGPDLESFRKDFAAKIANGQPSQ